MWRTGEIPQELVWNILVLIPKVSTDTWDLGLLDTLWNVVEAIIDTHLLASIHFHGVIHGFRARRGKGEAIMYLNPAQELASIDHNALLLVFLDLRKA